MQSLYELLKASKGLPVSDMYAALWGKSVAESSIKTITGTLPIYFSTSENRLRDWVIYGNNDVGKNLLENTGTTIERYGVTFTRNADGTVVANGTSTSNNCIFYVGNVTLEPDKTYIYNGCPAGGGDQTTYCLYFGGRSSDWADFGAGKTLPAVTESTTLSSRIIVYSGTTVENLIFRPMVREAGTSSTFNPYQVGVGEKTENGYVVNIGVGFVPIPQDPEPSLYTRKTINLGESPLTEGQTLSMSDFGDLGTVGHTNMYIAAFTGFHYDSQLSYNQPAMMIKYKE